MYEYKGRLIRIIDGNTIEADIDLGFNVWTRQKIRLFGIASTNLQSKNKPKIDEEKLLLKSSIPKDFVVQTILNKRSKIGRTMGVLYSIMPDETRININEYLLENGAYKI